MTTPIIQHQTPLTTVVDVLALLPDSALSSGVVSDLDVVDAVNRAADYVAGYDLEIRGLITAMQPMKLIDARATFKLRNVAVGAGVKNAKGETTTVASVDSNVQLTLVDDIITSAPIYPDMPTPGAAWAALAVPYGFVPFSYILGGGVLVENITGGNLSFGPFGKFYFIEDLTRRELAERYKAASFLSEKFFANEARLQGVSGIGAGLASVKYNNASIQDNPYEVRFIEIVGLLSGAV